MSTPMSELKSANMFGSRPSLGLILVVDDEPDIRTVVRMTLEKSGYDVIEAENGEQAIEEIQKGENPLILDVAIMDIRMPKINGVDAITYFREQFPKVPIVVLTGFPDVDMATSLLKQGVVDYLVKPVEGKNLQMAVRDAMEHREIYSF